MVTTKNFLYLDEIQRTTKLRMLHTYDSLHVLNDVSLLLK